MLEEQIQMLPLVSVGCRLFLACYVVILHFGTVAQNNSLKSLNKRLNGRKPTILLHLDARQPEGYLRLSLYTGKSHSFDP